SIAADASCTSSSSDVDDPDVNETVVAESALGNTLDWESSRASSCESCRRKKRLRITGPVEGRGARKSRAACPFGAVVVPYTVAARATGAETARIGGV